MKSQFLKKKPEELVSVKVAAAKLILKNDLATLAEMNGQPCSFFLKLTHKYADETLPLFVVSTFNPGWVKYLKEAVKPTTAGLGYGHCFVKKEEDSLVINLERGKILPMEVKSALKDLKIVPGIFSKLVFDEVAPEAAAEIEVEKDIYAQIVPEEVAEKGNKFADIKKTEVELKKALKTPNLDTEKKKEIEQKLKELGIERQKLVDELYQQWLEDKGWADKDARAILRMYGDNWFKFKDELAYLNKKGNENPAYYEVKLAAMEKVLQYRKQIVDALLNETREAVAIQNNMKTADIKAVALGSVTPTSDYDITFEIPSKPYFEYKCVKYFNETFLKKQGVSSGVLFDTNVYTNGFMPSELEDKTLIYKDKFNPVGKTSDLPPLEKAMVKKGKTIKHQTQLALSMVSIAQALSEEQWTNFAKNSVREVVGYLSKRLPVKDDRKKELLKEVQEDLVEIFKKAATIHRQTGNMIEREKSIIKGANPGMDEAHLENQAKDKLYVDTLEMVANQLEALEINAQALAKATDETRPQLLKDRVQIIIRFEEAQGKALIYSNEAYFSGGAAVHVVKGMQGGGDFEIGRQQKMQSMLMNTGYKIAHFKHQAEEHGMGRALIGTSKYGQRIGNIALSGEDTNAPRVDQKLTKGISESASPINANFLLKLETSLVDDYKKDDLKYPTPTDKEEAAEEKLAEELGDVSIEAFMDSFLEIATKSLAPFYMDKYNDNLSEAEKGKEDEVGFW